MNGFLMKLGKTERFTQNTYDFYKKSAKVRSVAGIEAIALSPFIVLFPLNELYLWMVFAILLRAVFPTFSLAYRPRLKGSESSKSFSR
ncbi:hypothetical protein LD39_14805 [Halobacillus sp. BBL2006]|nr:hypothetical protein LD39_14805 [Halobacillus sp. BBL2006]